MGFAQTISWCGCKYQQIYIFVSGLQSPFGIVGGGNNKHIDTDIDCQTEKGSFRQTGDRQSSLYNRNGDPKVDWHSLVPARENDPSCCDKGHKTIFLFVKFYGFSLDVSTRNALVLTYAKKIKMGKIENDVFPFLCNNYYICKPFSIKGNKSTMKNKMTMASNSNQGRTAGKSKGKQTFTLFVYSHFIVLRIF